MTTSSRYFAGGALIAVVGLALLFAADGIALQQRTAPARWVTAWGTSQALLGKTTITNATVRLIARVTIPGEHIRIRLDNTFGTKPLALATVYVGLRTQGATLAGGSNRQVLFSGSPHTSIPPGGSVTSDPVAMKVLARQDLAVSLHVPEADVQPSEHGNAYVTSYMSANDWGDVAADERSTPFTSTTRSMFWLKSIDVLSASSTGAIVAFGDSITDGTCSTLDGSDRWQDWLALRLDSDAQQRGGAHIAVVNAGIGANTLGRDNLDQPLTSPPGIERLDRDVLSLHGVTHMILFMGTNDIRRSASAAQLIAGMQDIIRRVKSRNIKVSGVTILPRHDNALGTPFDAGKTRIRNEVNEWIRKRAPFDAVLDFDRIVGDPANPDVFYPPFTCDGVHPSPIAYYQIGKSVPLELFK